MNNQRCAAIHTIYQTDKCLWSLPAPILGMVAFCSGKSQAYNGIDAYAACTDGLMCIDSPANTNIDHVWAILYQSRKS